MFKKIKIVLMLLMFVFTIFNFVSPASALSGMEDKSIEKAYKAIDDMTREAGGDFVPPSNKINSIDDFNKVIMGRILNAFFGVIGSLALLMFIYGAIMWMMSEGNEQQLTKAQKIMVWSAIGTIASIIGAGLFTFALGGYLAATNIERF